MKIVIALLVISCTIAIGTAEKYLGVNQHLAAYNQLLNKPRGPPRPPAYPGFTKRWQQLQRYALRGPPIRQPQPAPPKHKPGLGISIASVPKYQAALQSKPIQYWKNPSTTTRTPIHEKPLFSKLSEPYLKFPPLKPNNNQYDNHIQTNSIQVNLDTNLNTHNNPIQQVGEKGPIHTIPAPNLSPADRPANIEHVKQNSHHAFLDLPAKFKFPIVNDAPSKISLLNSQHVQPQHIQPQQYHVQQVPEQQSYTPQNIQQQYANIGHQVQESQPPQKNKFQFAFQNLFKTKFNKPHVPQPEAYQVVSQYPQQNFQPEAQATQIEIQPQQIQQLPQDFAQQYPGYHIIISDQSATKPQTALFEPEQGFGQQYKAQGASDKISLKPEFHSFNYNEQDYQRENNAQLSSFVSAGYNLDAEPAASEIISPKIAKSPLESLIPTDYVQSFFNDNDDDQGTSNKIESESKSSNIEAPVEEEIEEEDSKGVFYSSLPNKEAADRLANLQAAGKINSNLMQLTAVKTKVPMRITVPDSSEESKQDEQESRQDEYEDDGDFSENQAQMSAAFGEKIKPKRN